MKKFQIINLERFIKNRVVREWVEALIFALLVALVFRTWFYSTFKVPTGSMIPTIQIGDHLMADMHAYGLVVPFTEIKLFASSVEKGDIVIFPSPRDASVDLIKRVIAVEGDRVEITGETIYVNGQPEKQDHLYFNQYYRPVVFSSNFAVPKQFVVPTGKVWTLG
ncbi:MAG: signal peptidase I, partial [Proteobacteria bacterium]|nr:signal peptidase I [Pseudomonadota bacterium]